MKKHPAKYTDSFIPIFAQLLKDRQVVLDPFAGVGKIALIKNYGFSGRVVCNEIEPEWANESEYDVDEWCVGDAANLRFANCEFDAICTSPTYGNRMADHHKATDESRRITYTHILGRDLNDENTGKMQWGNNYRKKHIEVYAELKRVLKPSGLLIVNISNHIRKGEVVDVVGWHKNTLIDLGFIFDKEIIIETPRMKFGQNSEKRVVNESILIFNKL